MSTPLGLALITSYNEWRAKHDLAPITAQTWRKYFDKKHYKDGPPKILIKYLYSVVSQRPS